MTRNECLKRFGSTIRAAREKAGITQLALAFEIGLSSAQSISNIERGLRRLPPRHIQRLADALRISRDDLVESLLMLERVRIEGRTAG